MRLYPLKATRRYFWLRPLLGVAAICLLAAVDAACLIHKRLGGRGRDVFRIIFVGVLGAVALTSVVSLVGVAKHMDRVNADSIIGAESATNIRRLLGDIGSVGGGLGRLSAIRVARARDEFRSLHALYLTGAFELEDKENARLMFNSGDLYLSNLAGLLEGNEKITDLARGDLGLADAVAAADNALSYNLRRLRVSVGDAEGSASKAVLISFRIGIAACMLVVVLYVIIFLDSCWSNKETLRQLSREKK